jgi:hypothetical protein
MRYFRSWRQIPGTIWKIRLRLHHKPLMAPSPCSPLPPDGLYGSTTTPHGPVTLFPPPFTWPVRQHYNSSCPRHPVPPPSRWPVRRHYNSSCPRHPVPTPSRWPVRQRLKKCWYERTRPMTCVGE